MKRISFLTGTIVLACLFAAASVNAQEICRTAGFWGTHAGTEKPGSTNITEAVMEAWLFSIGMSPNFLPPSGCTDQFGAVSCNFEPPGPAGSPKECREAKRNAETVPSIDVFGTSVLDICGQMISLNDVPPPMDPAPVVEALEPSRKLSPFYYYMGADPLTNGLDPVHAGVLIALTVAFLAVALVTFERRDLVT